MRLLWGLSVFGTKRSLLYPSFDLYNRDEGAFSPFGKKGKRGPE